MKITKRPIRRRKAKAHFTFTGKSTCKFYLGLLWPTILVLWRFLRLTYVVHKTYSWKFCSSCQITYFMSNPSWEHLSVYIKFFIVRWHLRAVKNDGNNVITEYYSIFNLRLFVSPYYVTISHLFTSRCITVSEEPKSEKGWF